MRFVNIKTALLILIILVLLWLIKNIVDSIISLRQNSHIVTVLKEQEADEIKKRDFLKQKLYYVNTTEFIENEAREKLGMVKPDEHIVLAPPEENDERGEVIVDYSPNWKKWWNLFF